MGEYIINEPQLIVYLVFTLFSILTSSIVYCLYHHYFDLGDV